MRSDNHHVGLRRQVVIVLVDVVGTRVAVAAARLVGHGDCVAQMVVLEGSLGLRLVHRVVAAARAVDLGVVRGD